MACDCENFSLHLYEFVDEDCNVDLQELRAHMRECEMCRDCAQAEVQLRKLLRARCQERAPKTLRTRIIEQITEFSGQRTQTTISYTQISNY
ncbi:MAG: hypothetical protein Q4A71_07500 [Actinomycetaceae bacterium]|nr:hypothetical protein [Actinomycetaceae bacterium]